MRRPVTRGIGIAALLAGMMGMGGASAHGMNRDMNVNIKTADRRKKKRLADTLAGRRYNDWLRPAAPHNQRQARKKWRMSPHYRPAKNKR